MVKNIFDYTLGSKTKEPKRIPIKGWDKDKYIGR